MAIVRTNDLINECFTHWINKMTEMDESYGLEDSYQSDIQVL